MFLKQYRGPFYNEKREIRLAFNNVPPQHGSHWGCREEPWGPMDLRAVVLLSNSSLNLSGDDPESVPVIRSVSVPRKLAGHGLGGVGGGDVISRGNEVPKALHLALVEAGYTMFGAEGKQLSFSLSHDLTTEGAWRMCFPGTQR